MGKAYVNRKPKDQRPKGDFYETPKCLTWELLNQNEFDYRLRVLEPASGNDAIVNELKAVWKWPEEQIYFGDKYHEDEIKRVDFLNPLVAGKNSIDYIITNPPFSLFDEFVMKAKQVARSKVAFIGKLNFFGAYQRNENGIWKHLKHVYIFNRQLDFAYPLQDDGSFECGNLVVGWFIWDLSWNKDYWTTSILDIQKYIKKGK